MNYNAVDLAEARMLLNSPSPDMVQVNITTVSDLKRGKLCRQYKFDDGTGTEQDETKLLSSSVFQVPLSKMSMMRACNMLLDAVKTQDQIAPVIEIEELESDCSLACVSKQAESIPIFDPDKVPTLSMLSTNRVLTVVTNSRIMSASSPSLAVPTSEGRRTSCPGFGRSARLSRHAPFARAKSYPETSRASDFCKMN